jgi:homoserine O-acetyltransferase
MQALEPTREGTVRLDGGPFRLENGAVLPEVDIRYAMYGELNAAGDNALLVCHALSGSARVYDWWPEMFGANGLFDTSRYCVVGTNLVGGCYGSTGPGSIDPRTGKPYGASFPVVTIRDMVRAQAQALAQLGVRRLHTAIGGSVGGMQALQWAVDYPDRIGRCIAIGTCPLPAMGLALNHLQRQAIQLDPAFNGGEYFAGGRPTGGLALARQIAMISYKSAELLDKRYARQPNRTGTEDPTRSIGDRFDVAGYLDHQGEKFNKRFDANTYLILSKAMDTFELGRGYESEAEALRRVKCPVLLVGISTDWLFPCTEIRALGERLRQARAHCEYAELESDHGHDGFLADMAQLVGVIRKSIWKDGPQAAWRMEASAD